MKRNSFVKLLCIPISTHMNLNYEIGEDVR